MAIPCSILKLLRRAYRSTAFFLAFAFCPAAWAQAPQPTPTVPPEVSAPGGPVVFSPSRPLFKPLIGSPREPSIGMIDYTSEKGAESSLGGILDFFRWKSSADMEWGWGLFGGLWTLTENPDLSTLLVDDWFSGMYLSERTGPFSFRVEFQDQKSNLGDALAHTRPDIYFSRDNLNLAASLQAFARLRLYAGGGLKWPWDDFYRSQSQAFLFSGLEAYSGSFPFLGDSCRAYGTYHFQYQAQAGGTYNHNVQVGLQWELDKGQGRALRLAVIYYGGHSEFGQFFQQTDQHWGMGLFYEP